MIHPLRRIRLAAAVVAVLTIAAMVVVAARAPADAATAPGGPGSNAYWNEPFGTQGFATSLSGSSKVWYTLGDGELENVYYPETDEPDTYGLQYYVTNGSSFTDSETANTSHAVTLADPNSLTWTQTNTAADFTITKTYVADPARSVILVQTTFDNLTSTPLDLYADYQPYLGNDGMGNSGGTDTTSGDLEADNGSVASAMSASTGFAQTSTGYVGTASSGSAQLDDGHALTATYSGTTGAGHIDQTAQIPVAKSGATTFTLALAFDGSESAAVTDAADSLSTGFASAESSYESGWHTWMNGLNAPPASVTSGSASEQQYKVSLMEVKADEDKTYTGAFIAAPSMPWGGSVSANSAGQHGYHLVWTRDEYEMASALLAAGDTTDANAALTYIENYEEESSGQVKQNTWLNGTVMWGGNQEDEEADPIILAYELGRTGSADYADMKALATWIVGNGPTTNEERWEENGGYSPATIATEIAGLVCASQLATDNGDTTDASSWLSTARSWAGQVSAWTYTTNGSYGSGAYFLRITQDGSPNSGSSISIANGGGSHDDRTVVDQSFLELVRLGVMAADNADITSTLRVTDAELGVSMDGGLIDHRYDFDGYGETSSGADYTGSGTANVWPVLTGERGEYDVAAGDLTGANTALQTMANAASNDQISEQVWDGTTGTNGFTFGKPDDSANPLMWAMAQYVRLAVDISAGKLVEQPAAVCTTFDCTGSTSGDVKETVNVTVPVNTAVSGDTVYLDGGLSSLGTGEEDWSATGIAMTKIDDTHYTVTVTAPAGTVLSYKYDLGGNWSNVEQTASCGYVGNRSMSISGGTVTDTVADWAGPSTCGNAQAVIDVTMPAATPSTGTVYVAGDFSALGIGMSSGADWSPGLYPMTRIGTDEWRILVPAVSGSTLEYKFDLNGTWTNVEETSSCGSVANRNFYFNGADSSNTAGDTVGGWAGLNGC
jgi:glucoamylase